MEGTHSSWKFLLHIAIVVNNKRCLCLTANSNNFKDKIIVHVIITIVVFGMFVSIFKSKRKG